MLMLSDVFFNRFIRNYLLIFIIIIVLFITMGYFFKLNQQQLTDNMSLKENELNAELSAIIFLQNQKRLFLNYGERYKKLLYGNLISEKDRVKWVDSLLIIQEKLVLHDFRVQFGPQHKLSPQGFLKYLIPTKDIFYYSKLNILAGIHSDLDVIKLFYLIDTMISPLYLVNNCNLETIRDDMLDIGFEVNRPLFNLDCSLILFQAEPRPFQLN